MDTTILEFYAQVLTYITFYYQASVGSKLILPGIEIHYIHIHFCLFQCFSSNYLYHVSHFQVSIYLIKERGEEMK